MKDIFCEKCGCLTWPVHVTPNESGSGILHRVPMYRYCPNCKKIYEVHLVELQSLSEKASENE